MEIYLSLIHTELKLVFELTCKTCLTYNVKLKIKIQRRT